VAAIVQAVQDSVAPGGSRCLPDDFYDHYQKLAQKAAPVTVASLRDSMETIGSLLPVRPATFVAVSAAVAMVVCLYLLGQFHSDWLTMSDLTAKLDKLSPPLTAGAVLMKQTEADDIKKLIDDPGKEAGDPAKPGGAIYEERIAKYSKIEGELSANKGADPIRNSTIESLKQAGERSLHDLNTWAGILPKWASTSEVQEASEDLSSETVARLTSQRMIANLQKVILPMLYGLLGSLVYVVRHVAKSAAARLFRHETIIEHLVRPLIGVVAGFVIGWFMAPDKAGVIADPSVAPFALAFVGGYSVEVLFTILDRITDAGKS